jgi:hypothetical protein
MQGFSVESKTSGISSSSTSWHDLEARYKSSNEVNMIPRSPGNKPEKMKNSEDLVREVSNLAGQGASSNSERNWQQRPTCRRGKDLEDSGTNTGRRRSSAGPKWDQVGRPRPFPSPVDPPFDLATIRTIYSPRPRATQQLIRHRPQRSREERDTISERRGSS